MNQKIILKHLHTHSFHSPIKPFSIIVIIHKKKLFFFNLNKKLFCFRTKKIKTHRTFKSTHHKTENNLIKLKFKLPSPLLS